MTREEFELEHDVDFVCKDKLWSMRLVGFFWKRFMTDFWTTMRFPFQRGFIAYPTGLTEAQALSDSKKGIRAHELVHKKQQEGWWGLTKSFFLYFIVPLPIFFSGRWFIERPAYLLDIKSKRLTLEKAVAILWNSYLFPWFPSLMKSWFENELRKEVGF